MRSSAVRPLCALALTTVVIGCDKPPAERSNTAISSSSAAPSRSISTAPQYPPATAREGSTIARAPRDDVLFIADEDHQAVRVLPLPLADDTKVTTISVPGHPAQVIASRDRVLVTVRDMPDGTGALVVLKRDGLVGLNETARISLPSDAWGLALSPDESFAVVTSAWTGKVSIVDIDKGNVRATLTVGREPRGVTIMPDGKRAYVSHLTSSTISRIADIDGPNPTAAPMEFPAAPRRSPQKTTGAASLGYSVVPNPKGDRLFFARHGLDTFGGDWYGAATVDVWLPNVDKPLVGQPPPGLHNHKVELEDVPGPVELAAGSRSFVQPRAAVYRPRTQTLLVASEGLNDLVELDALMSDPTLGQIRRYSFGVYDNKYIHAATRGGAPSGIVLSADENLAYVHCRSTDDVVAVQLIEGEGRYQAVPPVMVRLVDGTGKETDESYALGRSLFYDATDEMISGRLGCTGCHPDGRDDGHVWHETKLAQSDSTIVNFISSMTTFPTLSQRVEGDGYGCGFTAWEPVDIAGEPEHPTGIGHPRQTPMIAGRVDAQGPYGWHGESSSLAKRIEDGFLLHRWRTPNIDAGLIDGMLARSGHLAKFIRTGLVAPKKPARALTEEEGRGKTIFESPTAQCSRCHVPATGFTDRTPVPLSQPPLQAGFAKEESTAFKTPSLVNVVGTAPYFHDGRFATLAELVEKNGDTMGKTSHLSAEEKKALVAYLETL